MAEPNPTQETVDLLDSSWNPSNAAKPTIDKIYEKNKWQTDRARNNSLCLIYTPDGPSETAKSISWGVFDEEVQVNVRIITQDGNNYKNIRDEVKRIVEGNRKGFSSYDLAFWLGFDLMNSEWRNRFGGIARIRLERRNVAI